MTKQIDPNDATALSARLAERDAANAPWKPQHTLAPYKGEVQKPIDWLSVETAPDDWSDASLNSMLGGNHMILAAEHGARIMIRAIIANITPGMPALRALECDLVETFGGFTCYPVRGGWRDEKSGRIMIESGYAFEVSFRPDTSKVDLAILAFARAGAVIGERWVHIEQHLFSAQHAQVNP